MDRPPIAIFQSSKMAPRIQYEPAGVERLARTRLTEREARYVSAWRNAERKERRKRA